MLALVAYAAKRAGLTSIWTCSNAFWWPGSSQLAGTLARATYAVVFDEANV